MEQNQLVRSERHRHDAGVTLVEILIAIVLMGGVVAGTMATLRATILSGTIHRDHSNAHSWLQSASDILYASPKVPCNNTDADKGEAKVRAAYDAVIAPLPNPQDWKDWQIRVIPTVQFWNSGNLDSDPDIEFFFGTGCDPSLTLQLVTLQVRSPSGKIIESVSIVK